MKIFKFIFSRAFFTFIALLLQIALFYVVIKFFLPWFAGFYFVSLIVGLTCFFIVVNKKEPAEYKLPWCLVLIVFPLVGISLFIIYYNPRLSRKESRFLSELSKEGKKYIKNQDLEDIDEKKSLDDFYGISRYLKSTGNAHGSFGDEVEFFKTGEEYFVSLKESLKQAKRYIFLQFFIIRPGSMWDEIKEILLDKVKMGVEVRVMYDYLGSFGNPFMFCTMLNKEGISCIKFNRLGLTVSGRYNNRDHRKIVVIDGEVAFTGGINISDEYINLKRKYGHWKDTGVRIKGESAKSFAYHFLLMNDLARKKKSDYAKYLDFVSENNNKGGYVEAFVDGPRPFYEEHIAETNFHNLISSAKKKIYITTPYLIADHALLTAIKNASLRGVDVRIVTPHVPDKKIIFGLTRSNYKYLSDGGVKIYEYTPGFIHSKQVLIDDRVSFIGTVNLDYRSMLHHFECGVNLYDSDCIKEISADFEHLFTVSEIAKIPKQTKRFLINFIMAFLNIFSPML